MEIYKRLLTYLLPYRMRLVWAGLFMLLSSAMISAQTYLVKPVIDKVIIGHDWALGKWIPLATHRRKPAQGRDVVCRDYFMGYVGQRIVNDIRDRLYSHIQTLSFSYFTRTPTGVIISRIINDVNLVQGALTRAPSSLVQGLFTMLALTGYILYLNWRLAAFSLIVLPIAGFALSKFSRRFRRTSTRMQEQIGDLTMHLHETVSGVRIVKAFAWRTTRGGASPPEQTAVQLAHAVHQDQRAVPPVMEVISMTGTSLVILYGLWAIILRKTMTPGDFFSFHGGARLLSTGRSRT